MFRLTRQTAKLANFNARAELHGDEREPAADLKIEFTVSNDFLSSFDPDLKTALWRKANGAGEQPELIDTPEHLPALRFPRMRGFAWDAELIGASVDIEYGIGGDSDIRIEDASADKFFFSPIEGGSVGISFRLKCQPSEEQAGKLFGLIQREITISIEPPSASQTGLTQ